ncbi:hypothetical protein EDB86DRAFT_2910538 [Lactarius hatsudake]|nr:hypothetical protein EDB86DRAFT_2910538 [Lactarius hatsudake]
MASSEPQETLAINGHVNHAEDVDNSDVRKGEHTGSVEPVNDSEQGVSEIGLGQSAQPEEPVVSPVLDASQPVGQSKDKPAKRTVPTLQTATAKTASGPPTPQVKKVLNSGRFGTGVTKVVPPPTSKTTDTPAVTGKSTTAQGSSTPKSAVTSNSAAKKSPSSTLAPASKATMPPKSSTTPSSVPAPTRRTSILPGKPVGPPARSSTLSASTSGKLSSATSSPPTAKPISAAPSRSSVVSPDSATSTKSAAAARPRASVTDGVQPKKAAAPRASLVPSAKQPPASARSVRTPGASSISSLREVKEDSAALVETQNKLNEVTASLDLKSTTISELETQIEGLKASLDGITADLEAARQNAELAELARAASDKELSETRTALATSQADRDKLQQDLGEVAKTLGAEQDALIETLRGQIKTLQNEVDEAREKLDALRAAHASDSSIAAAAEIDRQALAKAKEDLEAIKAENATQKAAHDEALNGAVAKISTLELEASRAEALAAEVASLRAEKEETSSKLSELEVEILESKEAQELAEEELGNSKAQIDVLRAEVAKAADDADETIRVAEAKESAAAEHLEEVQKQHADALSLAIEESKKLSEQLRVLQAETDELRNNLEAANAAAVSAAEEHARKLEDVEKVHQAQREELTAEIGRISAELEAQESVYNAKVQTVKDEHDQLLRQAFERAKDLQALRENSEGAIEQLRTSHQATVEGLKVDHGAALTSQAQTFQKQLSTQALELKATSEDLTKAKATLNASLQEVESLKVQLSEARQAVQATASAAEADQNAEIVRLNKELSNARAELSGLNEVFRATQESMQEMSKNHQMELEEAAERRTEDASKLRAAHDAEIQSIAAAKSDLVRRLSDLEAEVVTLRADATSTEAIASPKRNGSAPVPTEMVTKEELQQLHEAHNLKINDLQAQHEKAMRALQEQVDAAVAKADETEQDLARKKMEIMYLEQDQEENQDQITRLKEDVEHLTAKLPSTAE